MESVDVTDDVWTPKFTVMKEHLEHHIGRTRGRCSPRPKLLRSEELDALGECIERRRSAG